MISFSQFLVEQQNSHLEHAEDEVLNGGVSGTRRALNALRGARDLLAGNTKSPINMSVKFDGCVHADTKIATNRGHLAISDVIDSWHPNSSLRVKARDMASGSDVWVNVMDTFITKPSKQWVEVALEGGTIRMTADHQLMTQRGWVAAGDLQCGDEIVESSK